MALSDSSGTIVQRYEYDSFGNRKDMQNTIKQPYTYASRELDKEIGLYFYNARYYDPMEGRFISKDPIGFAGGDVNLYRYTRNNSVNYIDPSGLATFQINRELGGNQPRSTWNPLSHTFIAVTDANGNVTATYSWGNIYAKDGLMMTKWAPPNQPDDVLAATRAINVNKAYMISDGFLDEYVTKAYTELSSSDYERWSPFDSCKHKAKGLIERALELSQQ